MLHMLHRDGKLIPRILEGSEIGRGSLSWVGLENNELHAVRYIDRTDVLTGGFA